MDKAILPMENAHEPGEEAHQPLILDTPSESENMDKVPFSIQSILSQPPDCMSHRQRLLWLQKRRTPGLYAQCDECNRWRFLPNVLDRHDLPKKWYCRMNPDTTVASCSAPEIPIPVHEEEDLIHSEYTAGSLVIGRVEGWPWWPGMVDDCPDTEQFYWLDGLSDIPTHYNVVFFDAQDVTRAWLDPSQIKPFKEGKKLISNIKNEVYKERIEVALKQAKEAEKMSLSERLTKYSFLARYKGDIRTPRKINKKDVEKYQEQFKRKFSVAFPSEGNEAEVENTPKKRNVITLGSKKRGVDKVSEECSSTVDDSLLVEADTPSDFSTIEDLIKTLSNDNDAI